MKEKSIVKRVLIIVCSLIIFPILSSIFYFVNHVSKQMEETAKETVNYYTEQFNKDTKATMDSLKNIFFYLSSNTNVQKIMRAENTQDNLDFESMEESISKAVLYNLAWEQKSINSIFLFREDGNYFSLFRNGLFSSTIARMKNIYQQYKNFNSLKTLVIDKNNSQYCYYISNYCNPSTQEILGKVIFEININQLVQISSLEAIYKDIEVFVTNFEDTILYQKDNFIAKQDFAFPISGQQPLLHNFVSVNSISYYHSRQFLDGYKLKLDIFVPKQNIYETVQNTLQLYILFCIIILIFIFFTGIFIIHYFNKPIQKAIASINILAGGNFSTRMEKTNYKEINLLINSFNHMADNLENLYQEVYKKGLLLKEAEFQMLQAQVNPHFVFNVLETINMNALENGQTKICSMISALAKLLRSNILLKNQQKITFRQELEYVKYYLCLQKERFKENLSYQINLEEENFLDLYLPKLTIQPLVENALNHGLENKKGAGEVIISIWEEECIYIKVLDNGIGFDVTSLKLEEKKEEENKKHNHVALYNINKRIKLLYGEEYGIIISSKKNQGTNVMVRLPKDKKKEIL